MSDTSESEREIRARVAKTRATLEGTLDAIEDKFNVKKRATELAGRAGDSYRENPTPWYIGGVAVVGAVIGIVAWALSRDD